MPLDPTSRHGHYVVCRSLKGHRGEVTALSASARLLVSGGNDSFCVWNLDEWEKPRPTPKILSSRGRVSAIAITAKGDDGPELVAIGTGNGYLTVWEIRADSERSLEVFDALICTRKVSGITFNESSNQLAVCTILGDLFLYAVSDDNELTRIWTFGFHDLDPVGIAFQGTGPEVGDIMVFGVDCISHMKAENGFCYEETEVGAKIDSATLDPSSTILCMVHPGEQASVWHIEGWKKKKVFELPSESDTPPRYCQAAMTKNAKEVVITAEGGRYHIFSGSSGEIIDILDMNSERGSPPVVTTFAYGSNSFVATARYDERPDGESTVYVWEESLTTRMWNTACQWYDTWVIVLLICIRLYMMCAGMWAYAAEKMENFKEQICNCSC